MMHFALLCISLAPGDGASPPAAIKYRTTAAAKRLRQWEGKELPPLKEAQRFVGVSPLPAPAVLRKSVTILALMGSPGYDPAKERSEELAPEELAQTRLVLKKLAASAGPKATVVAIFAPYDVKSNVEYSVKSGIKDLFPDEAKRMFALVEWTPDCMNYKMLGLTRKDVPTPEFVVLRTGGKVAVGGCDLESLPAAVKLAQK